MAFPSTNADGCCERCGTLRQVGDWPGCPHGVVLADRERTLTHQDSIPGGMVLENYGPQPVKIYSHTERRQLMAQHGLEPRERFAPTPGTDIDPAGIPNPKGYVDPQTLANGRELILRAQQRPADDFDPEKVVINRTTHTLTEREALTVADLLEKTRK